MSTIVIGMDAERFNLLKSMIESDSYYAGIVTADSEILVDESGNEILGHWTTKEV